MGDFRLGGGELEDRVEALLVRIGFHAVEGREGCEDLVCTHPTLAPPLVVEVKSRKKAGLKLEYLRQLDDWVFALSGESEKRRGALERAWAGKPMKSSGWSIGAAQSGESWHPNPHKGLLVFSAPKGTPFEKRDPLVLDREAREFAEARCLCAAAFGDLVRWEAAIADASKSADEFWHLIQRTHGVLPAPDGLGSRGSGSG